VHVLANETDAAIMQSVGQHEFSSCLQKPIRIGLARWTTLLHVSIGRQAPTSFNCSELLKIGGTDLVNSQDSEGLSPLHLIVKLSPHLTESFLSSYVVDVNARDKYGRSPLHYAVLQSSLDAVRALLQSRQTRLEAADYQGKTVFHMLQDCEVAEAVFSRAPGFWSIELDHEGNTPLQSLFASDGPARADIARDLSRMFVERGASKTSDSNGLLPYCCAVTMWPSSVPFFEFLLPDQNSPRCQCSSDCASSSSDSSPNFFRSSRRFGIFSVSPLRKKDWKKRLFKALLYESDFAVHQLMDKEDFTISESIELDTTQHTTVLHLALCRRDPSEVLLWKLLLRGAHTLVNFKDSEGQTPIHLIVRRMPEFTAPFLETYHIDTNAVDSLYRTPLYYAVLESSVETVNALLSNARTDIAAAELFGMTPLHVARDPAVANALLENANATRARELVNARDRRGRTPLHTLLDYAGRRHQRKAATVYALAKILLDAGADKRAMDENRKTPLDYAMATGFGRDVNLVALLSTWNMLYRRLQSIEKAFGSRTSTLSNDAKQELEELLICPISHDIAVSPVLCTDSVTVDEASASLPSTDSVVYSTTRRPSLTGWETIGVRSSSSVRRSPPRPSLIAT
jgi:ankyrin repeat protein